MASSFSVVNNIASLNALNRLGRTTSGLNKTLERLSSGLRINSAADDASGLVIADGLRADVAALNQVKGLPGHGDHSLGPGLAVCRGLGRDIHHPDPALVVDVGEFTHLRSFASGLDFITSCRLRAAARA